MKISKIGLIGLSRNIVKAKRTDHVKLQPLASDTVSFGNSTTAKQEPRKAYRCIGESEYKKLIAGEKVKSSGFFSHEPMGWASEGWTDGFASKKDDVADTYFVTFNYDKFTGDEIELGWNNSKIFKRAYSIDDIIEIRKGFNVHGELVWSRDFEKDKQNKKAKK